MTELDYDLSTLVRSLCRYLGSDPSQPQEGRSGRYDESIMSVWTFLNEYPPIRCKELKGLRPSEINLPGKFLSILRSLPTGVRWNLRSGSKVIEVSLTVYDKEALFVVDSVATRISLDYSGDITSLTAGYFNILNTYFKGQR